MEIPGGTPHRITKVEVKEVRITVWEDRGLQLEADAAYYNKEGLTCGKLTVNSSLCSSETNDALQEFLKLLERDAASTVFDVGTGDEEASDLGSPTDPVRQI